MVALTLALVALLAPPPPGPLVVFWGGGRTFVVDVDAERLLVAPGWITSTPDGLWRYRLRADASRARREPGEPIPPPSRWTTFEQLAPGAATWTALTPVPRRPADGQITDEHRVVQLRGDAVTLARHFRRRSAAHPTPTTPSPTAHTRRTELFTLALPGGDPAPPPADADAAVDWLRRVLPGTVDPCVDRPGAAITLDVPGGALGRWLVLRGEAETCAGDAHLLRLDAAPPPAVTLAGARWDGERLVTDDGAVLDDVADARPGPGDTALFLRGAPHTHDAAIHRDPERLDDPCLDREVLLWRPGQPPRILGRAPALAGARPLAPDDPLRAALATRFRPADAPPCAAPLPLDAAPLDLTHACRVEEDGRPWRGEGDLAATLQAHSDRARLQLDVTVTDPDRAPGDGLRLYLGPGRRPARVTLTAAGAIDADGRTGRRARRQIALEARATPAGYHLRFTLDRALLGTPPTLSLAVEDHDPAIAGATRLWLAGAPIDAQNPHAMPLEAPR
ncbi:MAG: hypothetical protein H6703_06160 [Myxococcales bacterium]|nr:hypothetical protein [Myxococcales bacterium]